MFRALLLEATDDGPVASLTELDDERLPEGEVTIAVEASTVNYKDGLAIVNGKPVVRTWPLVPGIDLAGTVAASESDAFDVGDRVLVNGFGLGESHWGGFAERARVPSSMLVRIPDAFTSSQAMAIGTAGYTAMLCVLALERGGVEAGDGDVVVTGAAGGVGSVAVALLAELGHRVVASTGRAEEADYLAALGAAEVIDRAELSEPGRPLGSERWAGGVDAVGSHTLVNVLASTAYGGVVAACGLAQGADLPGTVMPFIIRGVTLAGVDSVMAPLEAREEAWGRLATDIDRAKLDAMTSTVGLGEVPQVAADILRGSVRGRVVVDTSA